MSLAKATTKPCPTSTHILNPSELGSSTTALGSLTVHPLKELFLITNPHLPWRPFTLVLLLFLGRRDGASPGCADLGKDVVTWTTRSERRELLGHCSWYKLSTWISEGSDVNTASLLKIS